MVGWFDAVEKGDALRYGGFQDLMINKTDALTHQGDWNGDLLICTAYEDTDGNIHHHVPRNEAVRKKPQSGLLPASRLGGRHLRRAQLCRLTGQRPSLRRSDGPDHA